MSEQPSETPLVDLLRCIPKDHRTEWEIQWDEETGNPTGHAMCPIGLHAHAAAAEIEQLTEYNRRQAKLIEAKNDEVKRLRNPWVSVDERRPKLGDHILIKWVDGSFMSLTYMGIKTPRCELKESYTHWMPIPEIT